MINISQKSNILGMIGCSINWGGQSKPHLQDEVLCRLECETRMYRVSYNQEYVGQKLGHTYAWHVQDSARPDAEENREVSGEVIGTKVGDVTG